MFSNQNKSKKEAFSYISPEIVRKNSIRLLIIEAFVLGVAIIAIIILLNYLGIVSFSRMSAKLFNFTPSNELTTEKNLYSIPSEPTVRAISDISGYRLTLENEADLVSFIKDWGGLYGGTHIFPVWGTTGNSPLVLIVVHLVGNDLKESQYAAKNSVYLSSTIKVKPAIFDVYIYLAPSILKDNKISAKMKGNYVMQGLVTPLFRIQHSGLNVEANHTNESFDDALRRPYKYKKEYFKIEKL